MQIRIKKFNNPQQVYDFDSWVDKYACDFYDKNTDLLEENGVQFEPEEYAVTFIDLGEDAKHEFVYISELRELSCQGPYSQRQQLKPQTYLTPRESI